MGDAFWCTLLVVTVVTSCPVLVYRLGFLPPMTKYFFGTHPFRIRGFILMRFVHRSWLPNTSRQAPRECNRQMSHGLGKNVNRNTMNASLLPTGLYETFTAARRCTRVAFFRGPRDQHTIIRAGRVLLMSVCETQAVRPPILGALLVRLPTSSAYI